MILKENMFKKNINSLKKKLRFYKNIILQINYIMLFIQISVGKAHKHLCYHRHVRYDIDLFSGTTVYNFAQISRIIIKFTLQKV